MNSKKTTFVFNVIKASQDEYGWSPSISEIAEKTGMNRQLVVLHLNLLCNMNVINKGVKPRQISINPKNQWKNQ